MHRYWYAMYPGDFEHEHYDEQWVARYRDEIPHALILLDEFLGRLSRWCAATDRTLVVTSSMGQGPSRSLGDLDRLDAVVSDPRRFLDAVGVGPDVHVVGSMAPQLTLECRSDRVADEAERRLLAVGGGGDVLVGESGGGESGGGPSEGDLRVRSKRWLVDRSDRILTLTYSIEVERSGQVVIGDRPRPAAEVGVTVHEIDDHSSGRHIPLGILGVANSPTFHPPGGEYVDTMEFAPAVLHHLGVEPAAHHQIPSLRL